MEDHEIKIDDYPSLDRYDLLLDESSAVWDKSKNGG